MDRLKKLRKVTRSTITKISNKIDEELKKPEPDRKVLLGFREDVIRTGNVIDTQDSNVMEKLLDEDVADEDLEIESDEVIEYRNKVTMSVIKIEDFMKPVLTVSEASSNHTCSVNNQDAKKTYKLPKIEIKKFNGELLKWLSFWSAFEKIHLDKDLHDTDKFHYLAQSMVEGTRVQEMVNSYPQTAENYPKVIKAIKERYGNEKILKQVYVRELIKMVVANVNGQQQITLSTLFDDLESHLRSLDSLGVTTEHTSDFLFPLVESSLPDDILVAWQRSANFGKDGTIQNPPMTELDFLMEFLKQEVNSEQQRSFARAGFTISNNTTEKNNSVGKKQSKEKTSVPTAASLHVGIDSCTFCGKHHLSQECIKAMGMSLEAKTKILKDKKACFRCLKSHGSMRCKICVSCTGCSKQHFHLMCPESPRNLEQKTNNCNSIAVSSNQVMKQVLLKTIMVKIKTKFGNKTARVFFDEGSQQSYIKTSVANEIRCPENGKYFERNTLFGGVLSNIEERTIYKVQLQSLNEKIKRNFELPDKEVITGKILKIPQGPWMDELESKGIYINDQVSTVEDIDILIGSDLCPSLILDKSITLKCGLKAVKTIFGWTVMGPITVPQTNVTLSHSMVVTLAQLNDANIKDLWNLEMIGIGDPVDVKSKEERDLLAVNHFKQTVSRNIDGRYKVELPWIDGCQDIPNNFHMAQKRLLNATKKLKKDGVYKIYDDIFKQWEKEGFIEEVKIGLEDIHCKKDCHFIPHYPVYKPESKTTPVRPVFDASCKTGRHPSLNECLEKGPNLIELIPYVMLYFREGKYGVLSDIRKAFQMIELQERDQDYLMFLWWEDESCQKLVIFKHKRVVFGVKSSPFILGAVINHHLDNVMDEDKQLAQKLKDSLYVDNSVTSVDSIEEYHHFKNNATRILAEAKMELRQWEHSTMEIPGISLNQGVGLGIDSICQDGDDFVRSSFPQISFEPEVEYSSVLGMKWNKERDTLSCATVPEIPEHLSKRSLLAAINKIFDPLGFLSPAMIYPKLILQLTWNQKIDWDEELPIEMKNRFHKWCNELSYLKDIEIPRSIKGNEFCAEISNIQVHVFNDASQIAYATVIFLRVETRGRVSVQLLQAKARMAPINKLTIPRLELMGCVIGARLAASIRKSFLKQFPCFYWSDSTTALAWIQRNDEWGTFVGNRVREILQLSEMDNWHHVPGKLNPADLPSRGCSPRNLLDSRWWEGPDWLKLPQSQWPNEDYTIDEETVNSEKKKTSIAKCVVKNIPIVIEDPWYATKSSYFLCLRRVAWLKRFINNCLAKKRNKVRRTGFLSMEEVNDAELTIVKMIQYEVFPQDATYIQGLRVSRDEKLNVYHVVTKLLHRQDSGRFKKPLLLPCVHPVVDKLIIEQHLQYGHAGAQFLVNKIREKFWIIYSKKAVKRIVKKCTVCTRYAKSTATVPAASLPENRVKNARVFEVTGIDLAGPLYLRNNEKEWIVIFTCAVIRAVHLELVEKIDTEQFILALGRFIYRRGRPSVIYTDCGTNFKSTADQFGKIDWNRVRKSTEVQQITWIFNPPASPWWGGFWERLIRTVKGYLRRILGHNKLTKSELDTAICFVESLMNGRPLTYISEDPEDLIPLTPAAFLQDIQDTEYPEIEEVNGKRLREKLSHLNQLKKELRERFRSEYLGQLVQRSKPTNDYEFEEGEIVLIASEDKKRLEWPMARILKLLPGTDGEIRVAKLKTSKGELVRSLQRLVPMEIKNTNNQFNIDEDARTKAKSEQVKEVSAEDSIVVPRSRRKKVKDVGIGMEERKVIKDPVVTRYGRKIRTPIRYN